MRPFIFPIGIIFLLGGLYFYQNTWDHAPPPQKSIIDALRNTQRTTASTLNPENGSIQKDYNPILARLLKTSLFIKGPQEQSPENPVQIEQLEALKIEIRDYLIASSDIGFPEDNAKLKAALEEAKNGDPGNLIKIRTEYQKGLGELKKLEPPEILYDVHAKSIEVVEQFTALLNDTVHQAKGSVEETWNSEERLKINERAQEIKASLIEIVMTYEITLPPGVLSY